MTASRADVARPQEGGSYPEANLLVPSQVNWLRPQGDVLLDPRARWFVLALHMPLSKFSKV